MSVAGPGLVWAVALLGAVDDGGGGAGGGKLALTDLAAYRAALGGRPGGPAEPVTFRQLWDHPDRFQGRRVRVVGKVARRFRQGAFGTFPPLVETWAVSPTGDPFCLVAPAGTSPGDDPSPGASVRFEGVFLRQVRYPGGDADRLAPLVVGDRPPLVTAPAPAAPGDFLGGGANGRRWFDWALGLGAAVLVALVLARRHFERPVRRSRPTGREPPPEFVDGA